jgi:hypothetical protein
MDMTNGSGQRLCFPDNVELARGGTRKLTDADMNNVGVSQWIKDGWLVETKPAPAPKAASKQEAKP